MMDPLPAVPSIDEPIEDYVSAGSEAGCDQIQKPGVVAFRDWILGTVRVGHDVGILRACDDAKPSLHMMGRAWDWGVSVSSAEENEAAEAVINWLLATDQDGNDHAMFRRSGLGYIIWNRQQWSARTKTWLPYTKLDPHTSHVHFGFSVPGAMAQTSFYRWIGAPPGPEPPGPEPEPLPVVPGPGSNLLAGAMGLALGIGLGYILGTKIAQKSRSTGGGIREAARRV